MRKILHLLLWSPLLLSACHSNDPSEFGIEPDFVAYNDDARLAKKSFCNAVNCEKPYSEELYLYDSAGHLARIDYMNRVGTDKLELVSYLTQTFNKDGQLISKIRYNKTGSKTGWRAAAESEYDYEGDVLKAERSYWFDDEQNRKVPGGIIVYRFKDGLKTGQKWYDTQNKLSYEVAYTYKNKIMNKETWYGENADVKRIFEHRFSGNRRQIAEYMPTSSEVIALVERTYDSQGRLATQETKVNNPMLCSMMPGIVVYSY